MADKADGRRLHGSEESVPDALPRKWTRPRSSFIDLLFGSLSIQLSCADGSVIQIPLNLIQGDALPQHLRSSPVTEIVRVDVGEPERGGCSLDNAPRGVGGEGLASGLGPRTRVADAQRRRTWIAAGLERRSHGG